MKTFQFVNVKVKRINIHSYPLFIGLLILLLLLLLMASTIAFKRRDGAFNDSATQYAADFYRRDRHLFVLWHACAVCLCNKKNNMIWNSHCNGRCWNCALNANEFAYWIGSGTGQGENHLTLSQLQWNRTELNCLLNYNWHAA